MNEGLWAIFGVAFGVFATWFTMRMAAKRKGHVRDDDQAGA